MIGRSVLKESHDRLIERLERMMHQQVTVADGVEDACIGRDGAVRIEGRILEVAGPGQR
jgi:hypothetical protein